MIDHYDWPGGREAMLRFGPAQGPVVLVALPFWEEANRMRSVAVAMLRRLADHGIGGALPDWPGTGESLVETERTSLMQWRDAHQAAAEALGDRRCYGVSIRGGALVDGFALLAGRWHLTPMTGEAVLRDVIRLRAAAGLRGDDHGLFGAESPVRVAGNRVSPHFLAGLAGMVPFDEPDTPRRVVRLGHDRAAADRVIDAVPPWRRAEPQDDPALATILAQDIASWIAACEG
ncbi:hypothetical protein [Sphingomonas sp. Leaf21]|uniref:hypothetical protein n=1 Tax=Sphingomonas sp. Leaf21 TaxID=2876550 RepID=UPI001E30980F|nr:hypothetical protein [Sphingomonas sp. Leaf21]